MAAVLGSTPLLVEVVVLDGEVALGVPDGGGVPAGLPLLGAGVPELGAVRPLPASEDGAGVPVPVPVVGASPLLSVAVPVVVIAAWLGHQDAGFTLRTYAHSNHDALADAAAMLGSITTGKKTDAK